MAVDPRGLTAAAALPGPPRAGSHVDTAIVTLAVDEGEWEKWTSP